MDQVVRTAVLWFLGSRNPAADCARLLQRRAIVMTPVQTTGPVITQSSSALGRTFEDRISKDVLPTIASNLGVSPPGKMCKITRHIPHACDFAIHYKDKVGLLELKNHSRAVGVVDRRRFFESILVNYRNIDWAIMVTSRCSVPHFAEKGYTVVGRLSVDLAIHNKILPIAFVCGIDTIGPGALERAIIAVSSGGSPLPQWTVSDLLTRGEITRTHEIDWGSPISNIFEHPPGSIW